MSVRRKRIYEFGAYRLDESERTLSRDGQALPLPAKAFDTLLLLVGESGHLLEKDEMIVQGIATELVTQVRKSVTID